MREYAKVGPTFWTGATGKALRRRGSEAVIVALYLVSSPHSNMLGLYYQPLMYMAHETGLGIEGASKGLRGCIEAGFCRYDDDTEMVFVHEMAAWQIADALSSADKRCRGIQKDYDSLPDNPFLGAWFDRYCRAFNLTARREFKGEQSVGNEGASQAPSKPHRSQEQEQEQEQEHPPTPRKRGSVHEFPPGFEAFWSAYPRKTAKPAAAKAFARLKPDDAMLRTILAAIERQRSWPQWAKDGGEFIPHPSTWLNNRRWEDAEPVAARGIPTYDIFAGAR